MKSGRCVFTIVKNEPDFFPVWLRYYRGQFDPGDIFVLDHDSDGDFLEMLREGHSGESYTRVPIHWSEYNNHDWLLSVVMAFQRFLLNSYDKVLFAEVDEFLVPREGALSGYIDGFEGELVRATGYEVVQRVGEEPRLDPDRPLLGQRTSWTREGSYDKPLLTRIPLDYAHGFHGCQQGGERDPDLLLIHLHYIEIDWIYGRQLKRADRWSKADLERGLGWQNRPMGYAELTALFRDRLQHPEPIAPGVRDRI